MQEEDFIKELLNAQTKEAAFKKLVHEYQRPLYNLIRSIVLNHDDSDDILQNTFIKIFQNIDKFKGESKLFSWMYRIATNEALTFMKSKAFKNKISNSIQFDYRTLTFLIIKELNIKEDISFLTKKILPFYLIKLLN